MKVFLYMLIIYLLISASCCSLPPSAKNHDPVPSAENCVTNYSECGGYESNNRALSDIENDKTYIEYNYSDGVLYLEHINTGFNCCLSEILAEAVMDGERIHITEREEFEYGMCDCLCLYDVCMELPGLQPENYTIRIIEPYIHEDDIPLEFSVNLAEQTSGDVTVQRNHYPWGIDF